MLPDESKMQILFSYVPKGNLLPVCRMRKKGFDPYSPPWSVKCLFFQFAFADCQQTPCILSIFTVYEIMKKSKEHNNHTIFFAIWNFSDFGSILHVVTINEWQKHTFILWTFTLWTFILWTETLKCFVWNHIKLHNVDEVAIKWI